MDLLNIDDRKALLKSIESGPNKERKKRSLFQHEIFKNKLKDNVKKRLEEYLSPATVKQMAIIKSVGMCNRIVKQEASIYKEEPKRAYNLVNDDQKAKLIELYEAMRYNERNKIHNRFYKLQNNSVSQIIPKNKKLIKRVLKEHQYDIIPNPADPEEPLGYVLSNMDQPDEKSEQRYVVWTKEYNFQMDGDGVLKTPEEEMLNPITPVLPFTVAASEKGGEFFPDEEETSVDFTVDLNAALTELFHVMRMQGFGQAVMTGSKKAMPTATEIEVGVNSIIALLVEEGETADFKFVNANPDLNGAIEVISTLLSAFLSSKGLDPKTIAIRGDSPQTFSSGWERFLSLIEKFEATKDDLEVFRNVERQEFEVVKAWHNASIGTDVLAPEFISTEIPAVAWLQTEFHRPEAIMTEPEKVESTKKAEEHGYISKVMAIKKVHGLDSDEEALELIVKMDQQRIEMESKLSTKETSRDAFNGAQVTSLVGVVKEVAMGYIPRESGINILVSSFGMSEEVAAKIVPAGKTLNPEDVKEV